MIDDWLKEQVKFNKAEGVMLSLRFNSIQEKVDHSIEKGMRPSEALIKAIETELVMIRETMK